MPGTKEIRSKIASVKSTQKITKAMQMVATSKMRRAQERMKLARPYAQKMRNVIGHLTEENPDYRHPFLIAQGTAEEGDLRSNAGPMLESGPSVVLTAYQPGRARIVNESPDPQAARFAGQQLKLRPWEIRTILL